MVNAVELNGSQRRIVGARLGMPSSVRTLTTSLAGPMPTLFTTDTEIRYDSQVIKSRHEFECDDLLYLVQMIIPLRI